MVVVTWGYWLPSDLQAWQRFREQFQEKPSSVLDSHLLGRERQALQVISNHQGYSLDVGGTDVGRWQPIGSRQYTWGGCGLQFGFDVVGRWVGHLPERREWRYVCWSLISISHDDHSRFAGPCDNSLNLIRPTNPLLHIYSRSWGVHNWNSIKTINFVGAPFPIQQLSDGHPILKGFYKKSTKQKEIKHRYNRQILRMHICIAQPNFRSTAILRRLDGRRRCRSRMHAF